jgi:hypothetical protein
VNIDPETGLPFLKIEAAPFSFTDTDKSKARAKAQKYAKEILRDGLELTGGALISSVITTRSLIQVGVVDKEKYDEEQRQYMEEIERLQAESAVEPVTAPIPSDMKTSAEDTSVYVDAAS